MTKSVMRWLGHAARVSIGRAAGLALAIAAQSAAAQVMKAFRHAKI